MKYFLQINSATGFKDPELNMKMCKTTESPFVLSSAGKCTNISAVVCRLNSNTPETPPQFCSVCVASEVCILITVNFVQFEKGKKKHVLVVLFHERYLLLPCVFEKDVKESTEFIHLCLLCNGMNRVQSNLYEENKAELSLG